MVKKGSKTRRSPYERAKRRKRCPLAGAGIQPHNIDYKDVDTLSRFVTERGKILPRRITGVSAHHQRYLSIAVKRARHMALMPFVSDAVPQGKPSHKDKPALHR